MLTPAERRRAHLRSMAPFRLRGSNLRYCLLTVLHDEGVPMGIAELIERLERRGLVIGGRDPHKTVSDVLRYEIGLGRVRRVARGVYLIGPPRPPTTVYRHRRRLKDLVAEASRRRAEGSWDWLHHCESQRDAQHASAPSERADVPSTPRRDETPD